MSSEIAIKVEALSKCFQIYDQPRDRLKQMIVPRLQRAVRQPPNQYYREFWALKDVSFEVNKGETVGIIGRNGSGKSTLLQIICGTLNPTGGLVQANGRIAALLELGSGFNPEFTGRENVYLNGAVLGLNKAEIDVRYDDIAAFADIGQFIERPVKTYSSGMYVRLAFAVQAMVDPDIFIVDEALAVGDEKFQRKCFARLEELKSRGTSILFVSHSAGSIVELCQKTMLLDNGSRIMYGPAPEAIQAYQKLLYAPVEAQERLIQEIQATDFTSTTKKNQFTLDGLVDNVPVSPQHDDPVNTTENQSIDAFDPGLIPETTTVYPVQGAIIDSIVITNSTDQIVNILQPGKTYYFTVIGRTLTNFSGIFFGIHIKSISGIVITGQRYPETGTYIENMTENQTFKTIFSFRMDLLPGAYFVGGGVWSRDEPNCAHRIIDALMFRVSPLNSDISFGYVDLMSLNPTTSISRFSDENK
ncbi:MAG: ABC transporter ATP-binding protein [Rhodoferax sp.]|uniref:ABC transporter ATP-binding protein n=1 Tax=Rhodoferax sp. TaxID=50421 RepID=UPI003266FE16